MGEQAPAPNPSRNPNRLSCQEQLLKL